MKELLQGRLCFDALGYARAELLLPTWGVDADIRDICCGEGEARERRAAKRFVNVQLALLATTDISVTDIAFAVGFGSFCAFSRAFRRLCGMTPTEFRKFAKEV